MSSKQSPAAAGSLPVERPVAAMPPPTQITDPIAILRLIAPVEYTAGRGFAACAGNHNFCRRYRESSEGTGVPESAGPYSIYR